MNVQLFYWNLEDSSIFGLEVEYFNQSTDSSGIPDFQDSDDFCRIFGFCYINVGMDSDLLRSMDFGFDIFLNGSLERTDLEKVSIIPVHSCITFIYQHKPRIYKGEQANLHAFLIEKTILSTRRLSATIIQAGRRMSVRT